MTDKEKYIELSTELVKKVFASDPKRVFMNFCSNNLRVIFFSDTKKDEEGHSIIILAATVDLTSEGKLRFTINTVNDVVLSYDESKTTEEAWREMVNEQFAKVMISEKE